jgi:hypothetical protein
VVHATTGSRKSLKFHLEHSYKSANYIRPEEGQSLQKQLRQSVDCLTVQVDPILAFISASSEEGSIRKVRGMLIAWEDKNVDTLHHNIKPSQETQAQARTGTAESISVFHSSESLGDIKDRRSPSSSSEENTRIAFRQAPPDPILGLGAGEQSAIAGEHLSTAAADISTAPLAIFADIMKGMFLGLERVYANPL